MRGGDPRHLSEALSGMMKRLELEDAALEARALMLWPEIVGELMARSSEAAGIRAGTLLVTTRSSAWNQEFSFQKETILRKYRQRLGKDLIKDVRFTVGPVRGAVPASDRHAPDAAEVRRIILPPEERERIRLATEGFDPELAQATRRALTHEAQLRLWQLKHGARECTRCGAAHRTPHALCPACRQDDATLSFDGRD